MESVKASRRLGGNIQSTLKVKLSHLMPLGVQMGRVDPIYDQMGRVKPTFWSNGPSQSYSGVNATRN